MESTTQETTAHRLHTVPQKEHRWLNKLLGEWTYEGDAPVEPDTPPSTFTGTEAVRSLGGLWIVAEGIGEMPGGGPATTMMTLGYDPTGKRFIGTWVGSMMAHLWIYDGALDKKKQVLTLNTVGPHMEKEGETAQYRDVIEFKSDDHRTLTAFVLGDDGKWTEIMKADYRRKA